MNLKSINKRIRAAKKISTNKTESFDHDNTHEVQTNEERKEDKDGRKASIS